MTTATANSHDKNFLRSGVFFVIANVVAGLSHYAYQVFASRQLSPAEFADLNQWFATLALFFAIGAILQYLATFFPAPPKALAAWVVFGNLLAVGSLTTWFLSDAGGTNLRAVLIVAGAAMMGWLLGQIQGRLMFFVLSIANLVIAGCKLGFLLIPLFAGSEIERYRFALFASSIPALWYITWVVFREGQKIPTPNPSAERNSPMLWLGPILLATAAALIPQMDLVLAGKIQTAEVFQEFARASLFYKGIFFFISILAQWMLPHQIRGRLKDLRPARFLLAALAISVIGPALCTAISPYVIRFILGWDHSPPIMMIFLSCVNMSLLAWLLILFQEVCAKHRPQWAAVVLAGLVIEATLQLALKPSLPVYFGLEITLQILLILVLTFALREAPIPHPRPTSG